MPTPNSSLDAFGRFIARFTGPFNARFIVQPVMAIILGVRDGVHDAREGRDPFICDLCKRPEARGCQIRRALHRLTIPIAIAIILDAIVQYLMFQRVHPMGAVVIGTTLMGLPYSLAREIANRVASSRRYSLHPRPSRG
jgi:hypothetical protein